MVEIVPTDELPPAVPFTCQVTAVFDVLATVAINCRGDPAGTLAMLGEMLTVTAGGGFEPEPPLPLPQADIKPVRAKNMMIIALV